MSRLRPPTAYLLTLAACACLPFSLGLAALFLLPAVVVQAARPGAGGTAFDSDGVPGTTFDTGSKPFGQLPVVQGLGAGENRIFRLMGLFLLLGLVQALWVADPGSHLGGLGKLYAAPFLVFWLVVSQRLDQGQRRQLMLVVACAVGLQAAFGIFEFFGGRLDWRFLPLSIGNETVYLIDLSLRSIAPGRAHGIMMYPTELSGLLLLAMPLAVGLAELGTTARARLLPTLALLLMFVCLALSFTRSGWLAVLPTLLAFGLLARRWRAVAATLTCFGLCLGVLVAVLPVIGQQLGTRVESITSLQDASNAQRLSIWRSYVAVVRDYFWQGTGINSGGVIFPRYRRPDFPGALDNPHSHNWLLQVANESGVPLGILFFAIFFTPLRRAWARAAEGDEQITRAALTAAIVGYMLVNCLDYLAHEPRLNLVAWLCLALL